MTEEQGFTNAAEDAQKLNHSLSSNSKLIHQKLQASPLSHRQLKHSPVKGEGLGSEHKGVSLFSLRKPKQSLNKEISKVSLKSARSKSKPSDKQFSRVKAFAQDFNRLEYDQEMCRLEDQNRRVFIKNQVKQFRMIEQAQQDRFAAIPKFQYDHHFATISGETPRVLQSLSGSIRLPNLSPKVKDISKSIEKERKMTILQPQLNAIMTQQSSDQEDVVLVTQPSVIFKQNQKSNKKHISIMENASPSAFRIMNRVENRALTQSVQLHNTYLPTNEAQKSAQKPSFLTLKKAFKPKTRVQPNTTRRSQHFSAIPKNLPEIVMLQERIKQSVKFNERRPRNLEISQSTVGGIKTDMSPIKETDIDLQSPESPEIMSSRLKPLDQKMNLNSLSKKVNRLANLNQSHIEVNNFKILQPSNRMLKNLSKPSKRNSELTEEFVAPIRRHSTMSQVSETTRFMKDINKDLNSGAARRYAGFAQLMNQNEQMLDKELGNMDDHLKQIKLLQREATKKRMGASVHWGDSETKNDIGDGTPQTKKQSKFDNQVSIKDPLQAQAIKAFLREQQLKQ